ncbi:MAG: hypothetical protein ACO26C_02815 [Ilumatobacteraceae bacterium]|jgi:hypothetical protein
MRLDAATVLLQWAGGGLAWGWWTLRTREVSAGYARLVRGTFGLVAAGACVAGLGVGAVPAREAAAVIVAVVALVGAVRPAIPVRADLVAACVALAGCLAAVVDALAIGGDAAVGAVVLAMARVAVGLVFLGLVSDAMLLGHWYLVQPGMPRRLLDDLVRALTIVWPLEVAVLVWPTGMVSVLTGAIDDGWGGVLGWFWLACALTTGALAFVARAALRERGYAALMAATGLTYLSILTGFGTDLIARALLAPAAS